MTVIVWAESASVPWGEPSYSQLCRRRFWNFQNSSCAGSACAERQLGGVSGTRSAMIATCQVCINFSSTCWPCVMACVDPAAPDCASVPSVPVMDASAAAACTPSTAVRPSFPMFSTVGTGVETTEGAE